MTAQKDTKNGRTGEPRKPGEPRSAVRNPGKRGKAGEQACLEATDATEVTEVTELTKATESDFAGCEDVARREGRNFHWGFRFLPIEERKSLSALYAFARMTDDIVDEETRPIEERRRILGVWRTELQTALATGLSRMSAIRAISSAARRHAMPQEELLLLIEGCEDDLSVRRYDSHPQTLQYCRKVAVTVGYLMLAIFGVRSAESRESMAQLGYAFQLTNIIRDVPEDFRRDRIYIAREDLERYGVTESMLEAGRATAETRLLMEELSRRAAECYAKSEGLYVHLSAGQKKTMRAMSRIYGAILEEIRRQNYDVWSRRPRVSTLRKFAIVLATSLGL